MIFLLIAGTVTPFLVLVVGGSLATALLIAVWAGAVAGIFVELVWIELAEVGLGRRLPRRRLDRRHRVPRDRLQRRHRRRRPDRDRRHPLHDRRRRLRAPAPRPAAGGVRLPRDLPRAGRRRGGRPLHRGGDLRRPGRLTALPEPPQRRHRDRPAGPRRDPSRQRGSSPPPSSTTRSRPRSARDAAPTGGSSARSPSRGSSPRARRHGGAIVVARRGGEIVGVSIAFDPGRWPLSDGAVAYELAWALVAGPLPIRRGIAFDRLVRAAHVDHEHLYLWFLGVDPSDRAAASAAGSSPTCTRGPTTAACRPTSRPGRWTTSPGTPPPATSCSAS